MSLPPLCASVGDFYSSIVALFPVSVDLVVSTPSVAPPSVSPSSALHSFWRDHEALYMFLLISHKSFVLDDDDVISFPRSALDPVYPPGVYWVDETELYRDSEVDGIVHRLEWPPEAVSDLAFLVTPDDTMICFKLV